MSHNFYRVERSTGRLLCTGTVSIRNDSAMAEPDSDLYWGVADMVTQYIDQGLLVDRPIMSVTYSEEQLLGVPNGAEVTIGYEREYVSTVVVDGSDLDLVLEDEGKYFYKIKLWPYQAVKGEFYVS